LSIIPRGRFYNGTKCITQAFFRNSPICIVRFRHENENRSKTSVGTRGYFGGDDQLGDRTVCARCTAIIFRFGGKRQANDVLKRVAVKSRRHKNVRVHLVGRAQPSRRGETDVDGVAETPADPSPALPRRFSATLAGSLAVHAKRIRPSVRGQR